MRPLLAVDPGNVESAYACIDPNTCQPLSQGKVPNSEMRRLVRAHVGWGPTYVEMVASYGMAVGATVFETCVEIGRLIECADGKAKLVYRSDIKLHHCGNARANDANITQALVDRFAHGQPNRGKGTKANPGWFYGFSADIWQAYALAVYVADTAKEQAA